MTFSYSDLYVNRERKEWKRKGDTVQQNLHLIHLNGYKCILTNVPLKATSKLIHSTFCSLSPVSVCMCVQIQSLQAEHSEQEQRIGDYEEELTRAREELLQLQEETCQLEEKVQSARAQLCPLEDAVKESHTHIAQVSELFICF